MNFWTFFSEHRAEIFSATLDHLTLVVIAMLCAILIGVPLGVALVHRRALRALALGIANVFQTIPSLALFGFLIPLPFIGGIGARTAIVALTENGKPLAAQFGPLRIAVPGEAHRARWIRQLTTLRLVRVG